MSLKKNSLHLLPLLLSMTGLGQEFVWYQRGPAELALSYQSLPVKNRGTAALGDVIRMDHADLTEVRAVDVALVTWATAAAWPEYSELNPKGYTHPISLNVYELDSANTYTLLKELEQEVLIPWRPETLADGSPYPHNGYAFRVRFDFDQAIVAGKRTFLMVHYNTETSGFKPTGVSGPFNELNIALDRSLPAAGVDDDPGAAFEVVNVTNGEFDTEWRYPSTGFRYVGQPIFRVFGRHPSVIWAEESGLFAGGSIPQAQDGSLDGDQLLGYALGKPRETLGATDLPAIARATPNGPATLRVPNPDLPPGVELLLESSSDLKNWSPADELQAQDPSQAFLSFPLEPSSSPSVFYRLRAKSSSQAPR